MQAIGLIDDTARWREFVAVFREKGVMVAHDLAAWFRGRIIRLR